MKIKEYLLSQQDINMKTLADLMYPTNASANSYLSKKLNGKSGRSWTQKDEDLAKEILHALGDRLKSL